LNQHDIACIRPDLIARVCFFMGVDHTSKMALLSVQPIVESFEEWREIPARGFDETPLPPVIYQLAGTIP
jgi:hypothetical protein